MGHSGLNVSAPLNEFPRCTEVAEEINLNWVGFQPVKVVHLYLVRTLR